MPGIVVEGMVEIPGWVKDLESFRRWSVSAEFPEHPRIFYLGGTIWVDPSMERDDHNQIKTEVIGVFHPLVKTTHRGRLYSDGMRLVHPEADLSNEPDVLFVRQESLDRQRAQLRKGRASLELVGSPDLVVEITSPTSVEKDTVTLLERYAKAGIEEYWLINALGTAPELKIFRLTAKGYVPTKPRGGWVKSVVFDKQFRLTQVIDAQGLPEFTLEVR